MIAGRSSGSRFHERGSGIAEFALASTFLLYMILGVFDFGRALFAYHAVANAARLGTRYAIVRGSTCNAALSGCPATNALIQTFVRSQSTGITGETTTTTYTTTPTCTTAANVAGCGVTVKVQYTFKFVGVPFLSTIPMASSSTMVISQ